MANIVYTYYTVKGPTSIVNKLNNIMEEIEKTNIKRFGVKNGRHLSFFVKALGGDPYKIYCHGFWQSRELVDENTLKVFTETNWERCDEIDYFLKELFPSIKIYWEEETEDGYFTTNDKDRVVYKTKYIFNPEDNPVPYTECKTDKDLLNVANAFFGTDIKDVEEMKEKIYRYINDVDEDDDEFIGWLEFLEGTIKTDNLLD